MRQAIPSEMTTMLMDYETGEALRTATALEIRQCREAVESGCEEGIILVDARSEWPDYGQDARRCWVDGDLCEAT